jgi:hypothetical protein
MRGTPCGPAKHGRRPSQLSELRPTINPVCKRRRRCTRGAGKSYPHARHFGDVPPKSFATRVSSIQHTVIQHVDLEDAPWCIPTGGRQFLPKRCDKAREPRRGKESRFDDALTTAGTDASSCILNTTRRKSTLYIFVGVRIA